MQQHFGEAVWQAEENNVFDLFTSSAQTRAEHLDESYRQLGIVLNQRDKVPPLNDHELAIIDGDGIRGSLPAIENRYLPKQIAGHDQINNCTIYLVGWLADTY